MLNGIVDILLVQLLRAWLDTDPAHARTARLSALTDPSPGLPSRPTHPARPRLDHPLAAATGVSRATLARRFPAHGIERTCWSETRLGRVPVPGLPFAGLVAGWVLVNQASRP